MACSLKRAKTRNRVQQNYKVVKLATGCGLIGESNQNSGLSSSPHNFQWWRWESPFPRTHEYHSQRLREDEVGSYLPSISSVKFSLSPQGVTIFISLDGIKMWYSDSNSSSMNQRMTFMLIFKEKTQFRCSPEMGQQPAQINRGRKPNW